MITIKTKEEIAILREGGARHAFILRELAGMVQAGVSTADLEIRARQLIAEGSGGGVAGAAGGVGGVGGSDRTDRADRADRAAFLGYKPRGAKRPYPAALCLCINDEVVHGIPSENPRIIAPGDIVTLDLGLVHRGMFTDAAVSVVVSLENNTDPESSLAQQYESRISLLRISEEALVAGIKAAKGGRRVGDIGAAIERVVRPSKAHIIEELCGHGLGYAVHEDPYVPNFGDPGTGELLKPGMILAIEPILTLGEPKIVLQSDGYTYKTVDGADSVQVEHTILITKGDAEVLTK